MKDPLLFYYILFLFVYFSEAMTLGPVEKDICQTISSIRATNGPSMSDSILQREE
jgi:hypothetical protein